MWPGRAVPSTGSGRRHWAMGKVSGRGRPLPWLHPPHIFPSSGRSAPLPSPITVTQGGAPRMHAQGSKTAHLPLEVRLARASMRCAALPLARLALGPRPAWPRRALRSRAVCVPAAAARAASSPCNVTVDENRHVAPEQRHQQCRPGADGWDALCLPLAGATAPNSYSGSLTSASWIVQPHSQMPTCQMVGRGPHSLRAHTMDAQVTPQA